MRHSTATLSLASLFAVTLLVAAANAETQEPEAAERRRALLTNAESAREAGRDAEALEFAEQAAALKLTASLARFMAEELRELGELPRAYEAARLCTEQSSSETPSENHDRVLLGCRELLRELEPQLSFVVLHWSGVGTAPTAASASANGRPLQLSSRSQAVEPGALRVLAMAPGFRSVERLVDIPAGQTRVVELSLQADSAPDREPAKAAPPAIRREPSPSMLAPPAAASRRWPPLLTLGVGGAGMATGLGLYWIANDRYQTLKRRCETAGCERDSPAQHEIEKLDRWTNVTLWGGLSVMSAAGIWLVVTRPSRDRPASHVAFGCQANQCSLKGAF